MMHDRQSHWEQVYQSKKADTLSWYRPHLETSLALIEKALGADRQAAIIDIGAGESTLVDDLLERAYLDISLFDISSTALDVTRRRLGELSSRLHWRVGDITDTDLPAQRYDLWHDRAVFHFLTRPDQRAAYLRQLRQALKPGGHVVLATFASDGPERCSGLEVVRYDAAALHAQLGAGFRLLESQRQLHQTPAGAIQPFVYCYCRRE